MLERAQDGGKVGGAVLNYVTNSLDVRKLTGEKNPKMVLDQIDLLLIILDRRLLQC